MNSHRPRDFYSDLQCTCLSPACCNSHSERCLVMGLRRALGRLHRNPRYNNYFAYNESETIKDYFYDILHILSSVDVDFQKLEDIFLTVRLQFQNSHGNSHEEFEVMENLRDSVKSLLQTVQDIKQGLVKIIHVDYRKYELTDWDRNKYSINELEGRLDTLVSKLKVFKYKLGKHNNKNSNSALDHSHSSKLNCSFQHNRRNSFHRTAICGSDFLNQSINGYEMDLISRNGNEIRKNVKRAQHQTEQCKYYKANIYRHSLRNTTSRLSRWSKYKQSGNENSTFHHLTKTPTNNPNEVIRSAKCNFNSNYDCKNREEQKASRNSKNSNNVNTTGHRHIKYLTNKSKQTNNSVYVTLGSNKSKRKEAGWGVNRSYGENLPPRNKNKYKGSTRKSSLAKINSSGFSTNSSKKQTSAKQFDKQENKRGKKNSKIRATPKSPKIHVTSSTPVLYKNTRKRKENPYYRKVIYSPSIFSIHSTRPRNNRKRKTLKQNDPVRVVVGSPSIISVNSSRPHYTRRKNISLYKLERKFYPSNKYYEPLSEEVLYRKPRSNHPQIFSDYRNDSYIPQEYVAIPSHEFSLTQPNNYSPYQQPCCDINHPKMNFQYISDPSCEPCYKPIRQRKSLHLLCPPAEVELPECTTGSTSEPTTSSSDEIEDETDYSQESLPRYRLMKTPSSSSSSKNIYSRLTHSYRRGSQKIYSKTKRNKKIVRFKKSHNRQNDRDYEDHLPYFNAEEPKHLTDTHSKGTSTETVTMAAKGTSTEEVIRVIRAVATNTDAVDIKEKGTDAPIYEKTELLTTKSQLTNTERVTTRNTGTDSKALELKPKNAHTATNTLRASLRNKETNTVPEKKRILVTTGTEAKPVVKVEKSTVATDPLYFLSQRAKGTNTSPVIKADAGTEAVPKPINVNKMTSPVKIEAKEKYTSYDKVKTIDRGVSPVQRQTKESGQQFDTVEQKPVVKNALTETISPAMYGKLVQTSYQEPKERKPLVHSKDTQTRTVEPVLSNPISYAFKSILKPGSRSVTILLEPPPITTLSSDISMHLLFQKSHEEVFKKRDRCTSPCAPVCGRTQKVLVWERTRSERIKLPKLKNICVQREEQYNNSSLIHPIRNGKAVHKRSLNTHGKNIKRRTSNESFTDNKGMRKSKLAEQCGMNVFQNDSAKKVKSDSAVGRDDNLGYAQCPIIWKQIADKMKAEY